MERRMKLVVTVLVCLAAAGAAHPQASETDGDNPPAKLTLAKKEKDGTITENPESFRVRDVPITCYVDLPDDEPVEVRLVIIAVKAVGLRAGSAVVTVRYKTSQGETGVTFTAKPKDIWAVGSYRADVYLDGDLSVSKGFEIRRE